MIILKKARGTDVYQKVWTQIQLNYMRKSSVLNQANFQIKRNSVIVVKENIISF